MKCINCTGPIRIGHELIEMASPCFLRIIACSWLKCCQDGWEEGCWRRRRYPVPIAKAVVDRKKPEHIRSHTKRCGFTRFVNIERHKQLKGLHFFLQFPCDCVFVANAIWLYSLSSGVFLKSAAVLAKPPSALWVNKSVLLVFSLTTDWMPNALQLCQGLYSLFTHWHEIPSFGQCKKIFFFFSMAPKMVSAISPFDWL